jgi:hypothetical protein
VPSTFPLSSGLAGSRSRSSDEAGSPVVTPSGSPKFLHTDGRHFPRSSSLRQISCLPCVGARTLLLGTHCAIVAPTVSDSNFTLHSVTRKLLVIMVVDLVGG